MKDFIKEGLQLRLSPKAILEVICRELENDTLSAGEREELEKQKKKAENLSSLFKF